MSGNKDIMPNKPDPYLVDDENPEASADDFAKMRPASEALPSNLYARLVARSQAPANDATEAVVIHLDPETAARLRAAGPGWEDRLGALLRESVGL